MIIRNITPPLFLNENINLKGYLNWTPFVSPDERYLIFSSHRNGGQGDGDLYICFRKKDLTWTRPINMGETINTRHQERFPYVSPDGKYLFFTRPNPPNRDDIWWVSAKIIDRLREKSNIEQ